MSYLEREGSEQITLHRSGGSVCASVRNSLLKGAAKLFGGRGGSLVVHAGGKSPEIELEKKLRQNATKQQPERLIYCKYYEWSWLGWESPPFL